MRTTALTLLLATALGTGAGAFEKQTLNAGYFCDGITCGDINRDGHQDIVAGPFWYAGPGFAHASAFYEPVAHEREASPSDSMFSFVEDFDADGWPDILVLGRVHKHSAFWYKNPGEGLGAGRHWEKRFVFERIRGESPTLVDIDGDGRKELICHWDDRWGWVAPDPAGPEQPWKFHAISTPWDYNQFYHGTGVGDVDGDGRLDLIINDGWWEQPGEPALLWKFHRYRFADKGGAQMFAYDVDGDGDSDIVTSLDAHGWGLAWFEQVGSEEKFKRHMIMGSRAEEEKFGAAFSQPHALALADIDGDGLQDLITGKRMWAHGPAGDIEPMAAPVVYWFRLERKKVQDGGVDFTPYQIDHRSGVGVQITVADVDGDRKPDVLSSSKLGSFLFRNSHIGFVPVIGEVGRPHLVSFTDGMTLAGAVERAGGLTEFADPSRIKVARGDQRSYHQLGADEVRLEPGDIVTVRPSRVPD